MSRIGHGQYSYLWIGQCNIQDQREVLQLLSNSWSCCGILDLDFEGKYLCMKTKETSLQNAYA